MSGGGRVCDLIPDPVKNKWQDQGPGLWYEQGIVHEVFIIDLVFPGAFNYNALCLRKDVTDS